MLSALFLSRNTTSHSSAAEKMSDNSDNSDEMYKDSHPDLGQDSLVPT